MNNFHNQQAEQIILGTCILDNVYLTKIADILEEKHFFFEEHQAIWRRFVEVVNQGAVDSVTLKVFFDTTESLRAVGGSSYLSQLLSRADTLFGLRNYGFELVELWKKRELEKLLNESLQNLIDKKSDFVSSEIENQIHGLSLYSEKRRTEHVSTVIDGIAKKRELKIETRIVPTGFKALDEKLNGGFYTKQLSIIGARTAVGKTTLLQDLVVRMATKGKSCLFISLEIDSERVAIKFLSNLASVEGWKIRRNILSPIEFENLRNAEAKLKAFDIFINDSGELKASDIERIIKNQIQKKPVDLVAVDYIQHIKYDNDRNLSATMEISKNVVALKAMAQKYDVALVAAAQINRAGVDKPTLAHFEGSSAIEKNADVALIIHREELQEQERKDSYYSKFGTWIIAKNRDGKTGEINFELDGEFGRFTETDNF